MEAAESGSEQRNSKHRGGNAFSPPKEEVWRAARGRNVVGWGDRVVGIMPSSECSAKSWLLFKIPSISCSRAASGRPEQTALESLSNSMSETVTDVLSVCPASSLEVTISLLG